MRAETTMRLGLLRLTWTMSLLLVGVATLSACGTDQPTHNPTPNQVGASGQYNDPILGVPDTGTRCGIPAMIDLWQLRANGTPEDYPMGPGDEVIVSVPEIDQLQNQHTRLSQHPT